MIENRHNLYTVARALTIIGGMMIIFPDFFIIPFRIFLGSFFIAVNLIGFFYQEKDENK